MKKYQEPKTIVVKLKYERILDNTTGTANTGQEEGGPIPQPSRGLRSVWKDDEE